MSPTSIKNLGGKAICYKRADHWDYFDINGWQATHTAKTCTSTQVQCGSGESKYCVPKDTYVDRCPVTKIVTQAPVNGQVYDSEHVQFDTEQMLVLTRDDDALPVSQSVVSYNAPCWD